VTTGHATPAGGWRARLAALSPGRSIKRRLVLMFLLLALALAGVFGFGAQRAFSIGWREAARPLLQDYVDRLAADIAGHDGAPPSIERAQALVARLPITVRIDGPQVNWASHPAQADDHAHGQRQPPPWARPGQRDAGPLDDRQDWAPLLERRTADGHHIRFGMNREAFERRPRLFGVALAALLVITGGAYLYVRRLLRPLDAIGAGAQRFGAGDFGQPIAVAHADRPDELGRLALTVNTMGQRIARMLEAKRALLLAISHELRSPLTRARLHAELLPEDGEAAEQRAALLRNLQEMADLVSDLLESERLAGRHATLHTEPTDLAALARQVLADLQPRHAAASGVQLVVADGLPAATVDAARIRLLLRNLLDNALRHGAGAARPPQLQISTTAGGGTTITVRDHGPGVPDEQLAQLAEAFYRPDSARTRNAGGVGLGLYLCRLVAEAHGGSLRLQDARPGLAVTVTLPGRDD
jgi:signal transduction histidine kinase